MSKYKTLIDKKQLPQHVAIIMDGNGRWAKQKSLPRMEGHKKGAEVIESLLDAALDLDIQYISLFTFSTENWSRPAMEIQGLWKLLEDFFCTKLSIMQEKGIKLTHSGSLAKLPARTKKIIKNAIQETSHNKRVVLNFCLNYGGRQEIIDAANKWFSETKGTKKLTCKQFEKYLYVPELPDVDLVIRTSGEYRISNFLLWQLAYAELVFYKILWPDFRKSHFYKAIYEYQQRSRRFGGI
jgi:undecaprenyl diphosphate synthase